MLLFLLHGTKKTPTISKVLQTKILVETSCFNEAYVAPNLLAILGLDAFVLQTEASNAYSNCKIGL